MSVYECIHSRRGLEVPTAFEPDAEFRLRMRQGQTRKLGTEHVRRYVSSVCSGLGFGLFGYVVRILVRGPGGTTRLSLRFVWVVCLVYLRVSNPAFRRRLYLCGSSTSCT